jgi:pyruvate/2-oxoglutarate dehydrogenase complex dihydrolipoamide dehydrogenase (E3) component
MSFDYNLVVIGGSLTARDAAAKASRLGARVALIEPNRLPAVWGTLQHQAALHLRQLLEHIDDGQCAGLSQPRADADRTWKAILDWMDATRTIVVNDAIEDSRAHLAAAGVDVIVGEGSFVAEPTRRKHHPSSVSLERQQQPPTFLVNGRSLRSPCYLLAPSASAAPVSLGGLHSTHCRTIDTLWQQPWTTQPSRLLIVGNDPRGIELAQLFNRLGCHVTLIVRQRRLLLGEDPDAVAWLQAHLEAEGIAILTQTTITQSKQLGNQVWVQVGDRALEADALLLASSQHLDLSSLNLEAIGVEWQPSGLSVNQRLQTTHAQVYACGEVLGGYALPHLADYEATIALKNALFGQRVLVDYRHIPWSLGTSPSLARVGLTEPQARHHYHDNGEEVMVLRSSLQSLSRIQPDPDLGKLIVRPNGEIVGAHLLGSHAADWISTLALAIQHRIPLHGIDRSFAGSTSFSDWFAPLIEQWQAQRQPKWQRELWENWFAWRR